MTFTSVIVFEQDMLISPRQQELLYLAIKGHCFTSSLPNKNSLENHNYSEPEWEKITLKF